MGNSSRSSYSINSIFPFEQCKREFIWLVSLKQLDFHKRRDGQSLFGIIKRYIRLGYAAFEKDSGYRSGSVQIYGITYNNTASLFPINFSLIIKGMDYIVMLGICRDEPLFRWTLLWFPILL